jgi:broad specificity phosphatase PhoE
MPRRWQLMNPEQFANWIYEYDHADIKVQKSELISSMWDKCYSSDLPRAAKTAKIVFDGEINETEELREVVIYPPTNMNIKLPLFLWLSLGRMAWYLSHESQGETKKDLDKRVNRIIEEMILKENVNVLIVSHGFLMRFLQKGLLSNGFKGENFGLPSNGKLYIFEK